MPKKRKRTLPADEPPAEDDDEIPEAVFHVKALVLENGSCPFQDWLTGIRDTETKQRIQSRLDRIERGNMLERAIVSTVQPLIKLSLYSWSAAIKALRAKISHLPKNYGKTTKMILKEVNEMFSDDLRDPAYAAGYLNITLEDEGIEGFLYALQKVARAHGMSKVASSSDISRESLYRALSDKGNPSVKTLMRVMDTLGLHLKVTASLQEPCVEAENHNGDPVATLHTRIEEEMMVMREQARAEQEEVRRATLALQEESRRVLTQIQRLTTAMTEQVGLTRNSLTEK